jgi:hypothetical protein
MVLVAWETLADSLGMARKISIIFQGEAFDGARL